MMMNIVALVAETGIDWGERAATAGVTTLLGMVTIFAVLALLWASIEIMHYLLHRGEKKKAEPKQSAAPIKAPNADDAAIAAAIAASLAASEDDSATVAAIVAAISAMRAEEGQSGGFRVVSFKRVGKRSPRRGF